MSRILRQKSPAFLPNSPMCLDTQGVSGARHCSKRFVSGIYMGHVAHMPFRDTQGCPAFLPNSPMCLFQTALCRALHFFQTPMCPFRDVWKKYRALHRALEETRRAVWKRHIGLLCVPFETHRPYVSRKGLKIRRTNTCTVAHNASAKQPYIPANEPYTPAKEPYISTCVSQKSLTLRWMNTRTAAGDASTKQPYIPANEPQVPAKEPYISAYVSHKGVGLIKWYSTPSPNLSPYIFLGLDPSPPPLSLPTVLTRALLFGARAHAQQRVRVETHFEVLLWTSVCVSIYSHKSATHGKPRREDSYLLKWRVTYILNVELMILIIIFGDTHY